MCGDGTDCVQPTTCHKFGAAGYGGHNGKVSGIIALACRHMFMLPGSIVDLNKREACVCFIDVVYDYQH